MKAQVSQELFAQHLQITLVAFSNLGAVFDVIG